MIITIDGPTASGKSSAARLLAAHLDYYYLYTGMLYRGLAYALVKTLHYTPTRLADFAMSDVLKIAKNIGYAYDVVHKEHIFYHDTDITPLLKSREVDDWTSRISSHAVVRAAIIALQRSIAQDKSVVVEGRDCGSVIFPSADYKFFLTAPLETRARRWQADQAARGKIFSLQEARQAVHERDTRDMQRAHSPLIIPDGALIIDNGHLSLQETVDIMADAIS